MTESLEIKLTNVMKVEELTPLFDRVLVEPIKEKKSELLIEEVTGFIPTKGIVVSVGGETKYVKVGDKVTFKQYAATEIEDLDLLLFSERDLLGVWR